MLEDGTQFDVLQGKSYMVIKGLSLKTLVADFFTKMGRKLYYYPKQVLVLRSIS